MDASELLAVLARRGVELSTDGDQLRLRAPAGVITPALRDLVARHKPELLALQRARRSARAIPPAPAHGPLLASWAQESLYLFERLAPSCAAYNIALTIHLAGPLDPGALARSIELIGLRHEPLRTTFAEVDGACSQIVAPPERSALPVRYLDLRGARDAAERAGAVADEEAEQRFDLARGPLARAVLLRLAEERHRLLFVAHHIAFDAWSTRVLAREIEASYPALAAGLRPELAPLPVRYADYAAWQRARSGPEVDADLAFWRAQLRDLGPLPLPADRPRPAAPSYRGRRVGREVPPEIAQALSAWSRAEGVTPFATLLAALQILLARLCGQADVAVGAPSAGRGTPELDPLIGLFVDTPVVRADLSDDPSFRALARRASAAALEAFAHDRVPLARIAAELAADRRQRGPLFQVMLNWIGFEEARLSLPGVEAELEERMPGARFDLTLYARPRGERLRLELACAADLFSEERARELLAQIAALLAQALEDPERRASQFSLVTPEAARRLPDPAAPIRATSGPPVHLRFADHARRDPARVAVEAPGERWTYGALGARSSQLARLLAARGVRRGDRVAVYAQRSAALVWALLGVARAGAAFVVLDAAYPQARLAACLRIAAPRACLHLEQAGPLPPELAAALAEAGCGSAVIRLPPGGADAEGPWRALPPDDPGVEIGAGDLAYVAFTSGTTGAPRGVEGAHGPLAHFVAWHARASGLGPDDRFALLSGLAHDPLLRDVFTPLSLGAALCVPDGEAAAPPGLSAWLRRAAVTAVHLTPAVGRLLEAPLPALRRVCFGGEALFPRDVAAARAAATGAAFVSFYGATETPQAMGWIALPEGCEALARERVPLGRGIDGAQLLVLTPDRRLAGVGELGEIYVRTPHLARGYAGDAEATRERFLPSPFSADPGDRLYRTGDLGRFLPDGQVEIAGRADRQLKLRGVRVEPGEVEAALRQHPAVREATVVLAEGHGGEAELRAYVVGTGEAPGAPELRGFLRARLPEPMVPGAITALAALPLTPNGKVDLRALPPPRPEPPAADEAPRTPVEDVVCALWAHVLGAAPAGRRASFFEAGGHSLLAARLLARVRDALGVELTLKALFEAPTVEALAARVEAARAAPGAEPAPALRPALRDGPPPASFAQRRLWLLHRIDPSDTSLRIAQAARLRGRLDREALERSLAEIEQRHEVLRITFTPADGEPMPRIGPARRALLEPIELPIGPGEEPAAAVRRWLAAWSDRPFDLERGPIWRAALVPMGPHEHVLAVCVHHIAADAASMRVLREELCALYGALARGQPSPLGPLPIQYADHAAWQRRRLTARAADAHLAYWREQLAGAPELELPLCAPRARAGPRRAARRSRALPGPLVDAVRRLARGEGATPFMAVLAALGVVLGRHARLSEVVIGAPFGQREQLEVEGLIGLFVEPAALRVDLRGDPTFRALCGRAREAVLGAHAHRALPFERVVQALSSGREPGRHPLFQVFFNWVHADVERFSLGELEAEMLVPAELPAPYTLTVRAVERPDGVALTAAHDAAVFAPEQADQLLEHVAEVLAAATLRPDAPVSSIALSPPTAARRERRALGAPGPRFVELRGEGDTLVACFEAQARRRAAAVAVDTGAKQVTYAELDARAERAAAALLGRAAAAARVALLFEHDEQMVAGVLGTLKAGGAYVPLDPRLPDDRLATIALDAEVGAILTHAGGLARAARVAPPGAAVVDVDEAPAGPKRARPAVAPEALAYLLYTSGSTGRPKGVMQSHRGALHHARTYASGLFLDADDRVSLLSSYAFDAAVMDLFGALLAGATLCPIEAGGEALLRLGPAVAERRVTVLHATPTVYRRILETLPAPEILETVRRVVLGGEEARRSDVEALSASFPPGCVLVNGLGPTECTLALQAYFEGPAALARPSAPVGFPVPGVEVLLLSGGREQVAVYGVGEIVLRSQHLALGYWRDPERTAAAFATDAEGRRLYRTGDLGRLMPDGSLEHAGRRDAQVKIRGVRVEPGEVEAALRGLADVEDAAVVATGEPGEVRLAAYVVPRRGARPDPAALSGALRERLPAAMIPASLALLDALPLTPTGKVDRLALARRAPVPAGGPLACDAGAARAPEPSRDPLEAEVARVWEDVLGVRPAGVHDDFFALGGHSLLAARLVERLERRCGAALPLAAVFEGPTVAEIARRLRRERPEPAALGEAKLVSLRTGGERPPFVCLTPPGSRASLHFQHLAARIAPDRPFLAIEPPTFGASGPLPTLAQAVDACRAALGAGPVGPLVLGGYSNGGILAFELARRLLAAGERVLAVVMLDAAAPSMVARALAVHDDVAWTLRFAANLLRRGRAREAGRDPAPPPLQAAALRGLDPEARLCRVLEAARDAGALPATTTVRELGDALAYYRANTERNAAILGRYAPPPCPVRVALLRAERRAVGDPDLGWGPLSAWPVEVRPTPGDHESMLEEPAVAALAELLSRCLDKVSAPPGGEGSQRRDTMDLGDGRGAPAGAQERSSCTPRVTTS
ncbi:amino acid adenylation domain-containing protein [Sorangium sp. So ce296]|uniref:amino acid adenylation domain-containing protein n=1 Tax=Sorangium sp. So ce296 TaxID=3133296 RepID=UPI003F5F1D0A